MRSNTIQIVFANGRSAFLHPQKCYSRIKVFDTISNFVQYYFKCWNNFKVWNCGRYNSKQFQSLKLWSLQFQTISKFEIVNVTISKLKLWPSSPKFFSTGRLELSRPLAGFQITHGYPRCVCVNTKPDMKFHMKVDPGYPKRLIGKKANAPKRFASCCRDARSTPCHPGRHGRPNRGGATLECLTRSSIAIVAGIWPGSRSRRCEGATVLGAWNAVCFVEKYR